MCTVTFIPTAGGYYFTSSRDEYSGRPSALLPAIYERNGYRLLYPKDPPGGGSWIAVNESGNVAVLLNGATDKHIPQSGYRQSRGLVLLDIISCPSPVDYFENMSLEGIEPFTVILFEDKKLYSGKWDGRMKWTETLNPLKAQIWSSVTLYDPSAILMRENWFNQWLKGIPFPGTLDIIHFHQYGGDGDPFNNILMKRDDQLCTNSISSIRLSSESASFRYIDLIRGDTNEITFPILLSIPVKA
jgi:Transport and Golgi organisation 2